jgi:nucleoside-diphosphate-sugar epimerase
MTMQYVLVPSLLRFQPIKTAALLSIVLLLFESSPAHCLAFVHEPNGRSSTSCSSPRRLRPQLQASTSSSIGSKPDPFRRPSKGKLLVLGGTGFLGNNIACRAILEGYSVTSLSRRGLTPSVGEALREATYSGGSAAARRRNGRSGNGGGAAFRRAELKVDYRKGDARDAAVIADILSEGGYIGIIHAVGLLFDGSSGLTQFNRLASGSGSQPGADDTYDEVTRITAFNAIDAAEDYVRANPTLKPLPFVFSSAAEAGWAEQRGGQFVESRLTPGWMKRYLEAKRAVESRLIDAGRSPGLIRPIIFRSSLIYSLDKVGSLPATSAFFLGNRIGLPFVDRPVTVQAVSSAMLKSISQPKINGILKFNDVDKLSR